MQLDKVVGYHKALADATRIKLLILLADGEMNGQTLAEKLCISPATVTHHAAKLREAGLINERREKNTIYFSIDHYLLKGQAEAALQLIYRRQSRSAQGEDKMLEEQQLRLQQSVVKNFFTADGRLKHIPAQLKKKLIVLESLAARLENGRAYTEKEINDFIKQFHEDFATIRREFIMHHYMSRDNQVYSLNPRELWEKWQELS